MAKENVLAGIDVGTTKIAVCIARVDDDGKPAIIGMGTSPCEGLRRGVVVNLDKTVEAITRALNDAELMAGVEIREAYVGVAGDHIKSLNSRGVIAVSRADKTITEKDIDRVIDAAKAIRLPEEREIIHVIPQEFIVDNQNGIKNPLDISGVRLEAEVHIVTGAMTAINNVVKCVNRCGLNVRDIVLQPLASSYAVLNRDEKELGCALIDIGGGTTDLAVFHEEAIRYTSVNGIGGKNVTSDIAIGLRTPLENAEFIKIHHACALKSMIPKDETIEVPGPGDRKPRNVSLEIIGTIVEPRMEEIFSIVKNELKSNNFYNLLGAGVVLTGGASLLKGSAELAEQVFDMPVKIGYPRGFGGGLSDIIENPAYSTVLGLVIYGSENAGGSEPYSSGKGSGFMGGIGDIFTKWFKDFM
jgi:cell division protein FtsA